LYWLPDQAEGLYATVEFGAAIKLAPVATQIRLLSKPSGTPLSVATVRLAATQDTLVIIWDPSALPQENDTQFEVQIAAVTFTGPPEETKTSLTATGQLYTRATVSHLIEQRKKEFEDAIAHAKISQEKNIFAGVSFVAPTNGNASGDAEVHLNHWILPGLFSSLTINKSSSGEADPKQFDFSFTFRKVIPFLFAPGNASTTSTRDIIQHRNVDAARKRKFLGILIDGAGRLEGDATHFATTNGVFDLTTQISTRTMGFGALGKNGYWHFRIVPAGVEAGRNLGSENPVNQEYTILRFKFGATLGLVYAPKNSPTSFPQRVTLDLQAVDRYLFETETGWDKTQMKALTITSGHKPWYQGDLKVFLVDGAQGRFGFRVAFIRGGLPPIYTDTRAFRFGVIFETADDKSSQGK